MTLTTQRMRPAGITVVLLVLGGLLGCNELTGHQPLPAGTQNPSFYNTPTGALSMRNAAVYDLEFALPSYLTDAGLLTDELESNQTGATAGALLQSSLPAGGSIDERILPELTSGDGPADHDYGNLQGVRGDIGQALGALAAYDTAVQTPMLRGELYALNGYVELLLADFFCSGVPLSTLDYQKDYTYHASSTTAQVYQEVVAQEDSALALASASDTIQNLARVLKGRALLALDSVAVAAQVVAAVPDGFAYHLAIQWNPYGDNLNLLNQVATVSDREGSTGLPFLSSDDPRTAVVSMGTVDQYGNPLHVTLAFPARFSPGGYSQFTVADGIEARLIQAEAALRAGDVTGYLTQLNDARQLAAPSLSALTADSVPSTDTGRVTLLFRERAYDLFLTGHRQGDLRRLIRQYGRPQEQVYPTGLYLAPGARTYGADVTAPIPAAEYANHLFHGCLDRHA